VSGDEGTILNDVSEGSSKLGMGNGWEQFWNGMGLFVHSVQGLVVVEAKVPCVDDALCVESVSHGIDLGQFACMNPSDRALQIENKESGVPLTSATQRILAPAGP